MAKWSLVSGYIWIYLDISGYIWIYLDISGYIIISGWIRVKHREMSGLDEMIFNVWMTEIVMTKNALGPAAAALVLGVASSPSGPSDDSRLLRKCNEARQIQFIHYLAGGLEDLLFSHILGMSSSQLTFIFFRGVQTTNQQFIHYIHAMYRGPQARPYRPYRYPIEKHIQTFTSVFGDHLL